MINSTKMIPISSHIFSSIMNQISQEVSRYAKENVEKGSIREGESSSYHNLLKPFNFEIEFYERFFAGRRCSGKMHTRVFSNSNQLAASHESRLFASTSFNQVYLVYSFAAWPTETKPLPVSIFTISILKLAGQHGDFQIRECPIHQ